MAVKINYGQSIIELVELGNFDYVGLFIDNRSFSSTESGQKSLNIHLFNFDHPVQNDEILKKIADHHFRPATPKELLTLSISYPHLPDPIIALGQTHFFPGIGDCVLCINRRETNITKRSLELRYHDSDWDPVYYFAAVKLD